MLVPEIRRRVEARRQIMRLPPGERVPEIGLQPFPIEAVVNEQNEVDQILNPGIWPLFAWQRIGMELLCEMFLA
jgi:hypothetical protein